MGGRARDSYGLVCSGVFKDSAGNESMTDVRVGMGKF